MRLWISTDIDECSPEDINNNCNSSENENCLNTAGSFTCLCNAGFIRHYNESDCEGMCCEKRIIFKVYTYYSDNTDINECANETMNNCSASSHQVCRNVFGSFNCDCEQGYEAGSLDNMCQGQLAIIIVDSINCS